MVVCRAVFVPTRNRGHHIAIVHHTALITDENASTGLIIIVFVRGHFRIEPQDGIFVIVVLLNRRTHVPNCPVRLDVWMRGCHRHGQVLAQVKLKNNVTKIGTQSESQKIEIDYVNLDVFSIGIELFAFNEPGSGYVITQYWALSISTLLIEKIDAVDQGQ